MDLALLYCYNFDREFFANLEFFAATASRIYWILAAKIYNRSDNISETVQDRAFLTIDH